MHKVVPSIKHKIVRLFELGPRASLHIVRNKIEAKIFELRWRHRALHGTAGHQYDALSFPAAIKTYKLAENSNIIAQANLYTQNIFDILGSGPQQFAHIPWHEDFRLKAQNPQADYLFDSTSFYKDIPIITGQNAQLLKDIKIPWELSRCQHLLILGQAYDMTQDEIYAHTFANHITDWLAHNRYMLGVNWICPMEVGIRATNWIWAYSYFKDAPLLSPQFWHTFSCSLYDHMHYLENNWEIYDGKTSNHYLSDLIGYFYLCWFFKDVKGTSKKRDWCYQELLREFEKQIFDEGTSYENTTAYHGLVTEIFDHFVMLCQHFDMPLSKEFHAKHKRMHEFIEWCIINGRDMIKIGDDDSGRLIMCPLAPFPPSLKEAGLSRELEGTRGNIKHYPEFGLSIIKTPIWHITLRHHAYQKKQPSGHIHNDALSVTIAAHGVPIVIDPGSYVYTASNYWRNYFRSVQPHNTFFIQDQEPVPFDDRLFALNMPENKVRISDVQNTLSAEHNLYARFGLQAHRTMRVEDIITITDWWSANQPITHQTSCHNFTLHPAITAKKEIDMWCFYYENRLIACMQSDLEFVLYDTFVSLHYGSKIASTCLRAQAPLELNKKIEITWECITQTIANNPAASL